jgi:hypothetical protein
MSSLDNDKALLDALRRVGVVIPDVPVVALHYDKRASHWHVVSGAFECMVSIKDASSEAAALVFALDASSLQPWYVRSEIAVETPTIVQVAYGEWCDWIRSR